MLKGIRTELNGDILQALCPIGHGDVVVADANFPSDVIARQMRLMPPIQHEVQAIIDRVEGKPAEEVVR